MSRTSSAPRPSGLVDASERPIPAGTGARIRAHAEATDRDGRWLHPNDGASRRGTFLSGWRTSIRSADADYLFDRDQVVARARDLGRNDPTGQSVVARKVNSAVGFSWRLAPRISARALKITADQARELNSQVAASFQPYAYGPTFSCDAERKKTFGQILRMGAAHICFDGEAVGLIEYAADEPTRFKTRLRMVDPDRLSNPMGRPPTVALRGGVERTAAGIPFRYWIREQHPADLVGTVNSMIWNPWDRYATDDGRPQVLHAFDEMRAGQTRGVTRFVSTLKCFRALQKFTDATLEAAVINALMVGFVQTQAGPEAVSESLSADDLLDIDGERNSYYRDNPVTLDGATLPVMPFGDEIKLATSARDTTGFDAFTRAILRLIAASLGVTYEELSMDFSQTNYSSARAALSIAWQETLAFRGLIKAQIADPFYLAWLEEAIDLGEVTLPKGAPAFWDAPDAYVECDWIGPARGYIDPVKEILAVAARIESQTSTLQKECADQGEDWEEVLEQLAAEAALKKKLGLENTDAAEAQAIQDTKNPAKQAPSPADPEGDPVAEPAPEDARPADTNKKGAKATLSAATRAALMANAALPDEPAPRNGAA